MRRKTVLPILLLLSLASCRRAEEVTEYQVRGAQSGMRVSSELVRRAEAAAVEEVSSLSSLRVGAILSKGETTLAFPPPLGEAPAIAAEGIIHDATLVQRFIELLRVNVREMLNASGDRTETLREYLASLTSHRGRGEARLRALREREDDLQDDEHRLRRSVETLREDLDEAIRGGEGTSASALMEDLLERQTALAKVQTELVVVQNSRGAFDRILPTLSDRLRAIQANQEALIKGVRVVDIPGVEDLGIIVVEEGKARIRGR
jgi:two-component sensor histidine kinase